MLELVEVVTVPSAAVDCVVVVVVLDPSELDDETLDVETVLPLASVDVVAGVTVLVVGGGAEGADDEPAHTVIPSDVVPLGTDPAGQAPLDAVLGVDGGLPKSEGAGVPLAGEVPGGDVSQEPPRAVI